MDRRYCLITPCRDEARFGRRTLESVVRQSLPPALWIIVDDGSKDGTPQLLAEYAARYPFIRVITRRDRGDRKLGGGVIDAFYSGYDTIAPADYGYVCKLDLDLDLPPRYFELCIERMEADPRIGTCSGKPYFPLPGHDGPVQLPLRDPTGFVSEMIGDENSVGMVKLYRTGCFQQIGGFTRELMWDGIDGHRCRQLGWVAISWDDPEMRFIHLRPMGTSHKNWWIGRQRHGFGQYFMGTSPIYMLANAVNRFTEKPYVLAGSAMLWGYVWSWLRRLPRYENAEFRRFLRHWQWRALVVGKQRAVEEVLRERSAAR